MPEAIYHFNSTQNTIIRVSYNDTLNNQLNNTFMDSNYTFYSYKMGFFNIVIEREDLLTGKKTKLFKFCHWYSAVNAVQLANNLCIILNDLAPSKKI